MFKSFRLLHHYLHNVKNTKNAEKTTKSKKKGSGPYCTARTRFFLNMQFSLGVR